MKKPFHAAIEAIKIYHDYDKTPPTMLIYMLDDGTPGVKYNSNIPDDVAVPFLEELIASKKKSPG
jgi:hypothetical protein